MQTRCISTGETLAWDECLSCALAGANTCGWDYGLLRAVQQHQARERNGIHVSDVKSCLLKAYWQRTKEAEVSPPSESMYTMLGTLTHALIEGSDHQVWAEVPVTMVVKGTPLYGTVDAYYPEQGRIVDYKTTRYINKSKLPYGDHEAQLRIYAVMLRKMGLKVESAAIQYIDLTGPARCRYCKTGRLIPGLEIYTCENCEREWSAQDEQIHSGACLYEVSLEGLEHVEDEIQARVSELQACLTSKQEPVGEPGWLCAYCPFKRECPYAP